MQLILPRRMPSREWLQDAIHSEFSGCGLGPMGIIVDDQDDNAVIVVAFPQERSREGAVAMSKFYVSARHAQSRDEVERLVKKAAKKAMRSLMKQVAMEKARPLNG